MYKSIPLCIVLTIVTFGIYGIYWMYTINSVASQVNPTEWNKGFGMVILLSIITCGIYTYFWYFKLGKAFAPFTGGDNSTLYLILAIVVPGLGSYINLSLIQNDINKLYPAS